VLNRCSRLFYTIAKKAKYVDSSSQGRRAVKKTRKGKVMVSPHSSGNNLLFESAGREACADQNQLIPNIGTRTSQELNSIIYFIVICNLYLNTRSTEFGPAVFIKHGFETLPWSNYSSIKGKVF
jgi:hypothetical protein